MCVCMWNAYTHTLQVKPKTTQPLYFKRSHENIVSKLQICIKETGSQALKKPEVVPSHFSEHLRMRLRTNVIHTGQGKLWASNLSAHSLLPMQDPPQFFTCVMYTTKKLGRNWKYVLVSAMANLP